MLMAVVEVDLVWLQKTIREPSFNIRHDSVLMLPRHRVVAVENLSFCSSVARRTGFSGPSHLWRVLSLIV